jgi:hypothetical protein
MPFAFALAWRLLLAVALIASPIAALASADGCGHSTSAVAPAVKASPPIAPTPQAMADMPGCTDMADMAPAKPAGKADPAPATPGHASCSANACCLGGAVGMGALALTLDAPAARPLRADLRDATLPSPPPGLLLRPPIG